MKKWLFPFLTIIVTLVPWYIGAAQDAVSFTSVEIDLWPEYDHPDMLVIYRIELSPQVVLPAELRIQIPAAAGEPNAVAVRDPGGSLLNAPYEREINGDWAVITLTASMPGIQIEYYDPRLTISGSDRNYELSWMGDYPTDSLFVRLQQPLDAEQVQTVPAAASTTQGTDGMTYHTIDFGPQPAGSASSITVSYIKESDTLTVERFDVQPITPLSGSTSGRVNLMDVLPWGLGILGILLLIGGAWWYWQTGREKPKTRRSSRRQPSRGRRPTQQGTRTSRTDQSIPAPEDNGVYCHQCGKRAESGDRFCRACGTKLRAA